MQRRLHAGVQGRERARCRGSGRAEEVTLLCDPVSDAPPKCGGLGPHWPHPGPGPGARMTCLEATEWKSGSWGSGKSWDREKAMGGKPLGGSQLREHAWSPGHSWNSWAALGHSTPVFRDTSKGPSCIQSHLQAPTLPDTLPLEICSMDPFHASSGNGAFL